MDPYLERPSFWPGVRLLLIVAIADDLAPRLRPRYYVEVEERLVLTAAEDVAADIRPDLMVTKPGVHEAPSSFRLAQPVTVALPERIRLAYLELRTVADNQVITVIEVLSPFNKRAGPGRADYARKRLRLLARPVNLVEVDLLRAGKPMPMAGTPDEADYRILVSPWDRRPQADLYAFTVQDAIPVIPVPLAGDDPPAPLALGPLLHGVYERGGYDLRIDYRADPVPPLAPERGAWLDALPGSAGLRG
jgi:hypothetical protein